MNEGFIFVAIIAYLIGSIPMAYLIVRYSSGLDLRKEGTGNIGALNSFEVTNRRWIGVAVFLADAIKGAVAVGIAYLIYGDYFDMLLTAAVFAVLGHNYSLFLKFKGGRGLSTAAGAFCCINPFAIFLWCIMWLVGYYVVRKHVHVGNIFASIMSAILIFFAPWDALVITNVNSYIIVEKYYIAVLVVNSLFLIKHIIPFKELLESNQ